MEISGNNRYELLFMDDESGSPSAIQDVTPKKKLTNNAVGEEHGKKPLKKLNSNAEKENKDTNKLKNDKKAVKQNPSNAKITGNTIAGNKGNRSSSSAANELGSLNSLKGQSNELREKRYNKFNFREGEFGNKTELGANDQQRQVRRDNKGQMRSNRFGDGGFRGGKREFDRQSGSDKTGVKAVDKRDGAGAHNWGSVKQEIEEINNSATDLEPTQLEKEDLTTEQNSEQPAVQEEETKEMTLDEWKAITQREKPKYNLRKAGEGEDPTLWTKMVVLNKKKEDGESEEELEYDPSLYPQRVGRLQRIVDIQFNFNDGRRGGFGRGRGRGGRASGNFNDKFSGRSDSERYGVTADNGRQNTGKPRYGQIQRPGHNQLKVDDERQFPTLN